MGEVVGAGLLAHVPTIMLPRAERLELNEGKEISLVPGLEGLRSSYRATRCGYFQRRRRARSVASRASRRALSPGYDSCDG